MMFSENFPIADTRNNFVLEFLDYYIDPPRYTIEECLTRGLTGAVSNCRKSWKDFSCTSRKSG